MRITRGDNWSFFFLPGLTLLALLGTYLAGNIYRFMRSEKELIIYSATNPHTVFIICDGQKFEAHKIRESVWKLLTKDCFGTISLEVNNKNIGTCSKTMDDFSRVEIKADSKEFSVNDCSYLK